MKLDLDSIRDPRVRTFYALYWPQHQIIVDFFARLTEAQFDYRMVDTPERRSDTPRESLAHLLYVQLVYLEGVRAGKLEYKPMGVEHYRQMTKAQLMAEQERIDGEMLAYLTSEAFDSGREIGVFWGGRLNAVDVLFFLRDHDILHVGWNLAYMDHLDVPRFDSLVRYWGP
ncbi:MAG: DinB family protein [Anaerolineae bacterium]|nr:DinB family protein [Anaerolineae bacterium]